MARPKKEDQLIKAKQARAKAEQDVRRASKAIKDADRKADTRRKIIIGGYVIAQMAHKPALVKFVGGIVRQLDRPADIDLFSGWDALEPLGDDHGEPH